VSSYFKSSLSAQPDEARRFILYFQTGTTLLTVESRKKIPEIVAALNEVKLYDLYIIGHTDTQGSAESNYQLGLKRAESMQQRLTKYFTLNQSIQLISYGEGDPLIPTADGINKAENRRVEIEIH